MFDKNICEHLITTPAINLHYIIQTLRYIWSQITGRIILKSEQWTGFWISTGSQTTNWYSCKTEALIHMQGTQRCLSYICFNLKRSHIRNMLYSLIWIATKMSGVQSCPPEIVNLSKQIFSGDMGAERENEISLLSQCGSKFYLLIGLLLLELWKSLRIKSKWPEIW